jgi:hypothetical protein
VRLLCTVYDARAGRYRLDYALFFELFTASRSRSRRSRWLIAASRGGRRAPAPR